MTCPKCGKPIIFMRDAFGKAIACEPGRRMFQTFPSPHKFLAWNGGMLEGVPDDNAGFVEGHLPHSEVCPNV